MTSREKNIQNELILLECHNGGEEGFKNLVASWERPLFYYIRRMVDKEEDVWDILQEVWLCVLKGVGKLHNPQAMPAWLYKIAHNETVNHLKNATKFQPESLSEAYVEIKVEQNENCLSFSKYDVELIHFALGRLTLAHREVLTLYFLESFSLNDIADITGNPIGTVKSRLYYAKKRLKDILKNEVQKNERQ